MNDETMHFYNKFVKKSFCYNKLYRTYQKLLYVFQNSDLKV